VRSGDPKSITLRTSWSLITLQEQMIMAGPREHWDPGRVPYVVAHKIADVLQVVAAADSFDRIRAQLCAILV